MENERNPWEVTDVRRLILTRIGEGIRHYLTESCEPVPDNISELLRRLDDSHDERPKPSA
jgi:hypothetical protein